MAINNVHSITDVKKEHCYDTRGSRPLRVFCSDLNYYVCKYHAGPGFPFLLFNEYLAASLLKIWNLPVPEFAFADISRDHLNETMLPFHFFDIPCFGSRFMGGFKEVDKIFLETPAIRKENETGRNTFLKIALFDIWLCNEDRHFENFNLLYDFKKNVFVPIDHAFCFNSGNMDKESCLIAENESLLSTPFLSRFFDRNLQHNREEIRLRIISEFVRDIRLCNDQIDKILSEIPASWRPDPVYLKSRLQFFFSDKWLKTCQNYFSKLFYLQLNRH